ncbi:glycosyltransferase [Vibrio cholerae]|uniref:glycosyltransferase n=3 Tax=Vibrio TaxID=662 RepID=UPI0011DAF045|nr:glycosyltransferase [Vibrio cholerae]TXX95569.1 glycosyltransferase [Vibrio cholerae]GIC27507.1 glycosyl transferase [Vibrio cholerae]
MKIKFLIRDLKIEGVQFVVIRFARLLKNHGHNVEIITLFNEKQITKIDDLIISSLNISNNTKDLKLIYNKFKNWHEKNYNNFDILFAPHGESIRLISKINDTRLVPYIHNSDENSYQNRSFLRKLKYIYKTKRRLKGKHILCVSEGIKKFTDKICGKKILSNHVIYNPFDIDEIQRLSLEKKENIEFDYLLFVGRLENQKRIDRLLKSFSLLKNKEIKLIIMGEGSLFNDIKKLIHRLKLSDRVIIKNFEINPYPTMKQAKCLILTSDYEGFGNVLVESLSVGTPAISTNCPSGPSEILTGNLSQYLIDSYDENVIAQHIDQVLSMTSHPHLSEGYRRFHQDHIYQSFLEIVSQWKYSDH